ncbi:unnamed protein product [Lampetra fluviatilis]
MRVVRQTGEPVQLGECRTHTAGPCGDPSRHAPDHAVWHTLLLLTFHYSRDVTWHRGSGTGELQGPRLDGELHPIALISIQQWTDHGDGDVTEGHHHRTAWAHRGVVG